MRGGSGLGAALLTAASAVLYGLAFPPTSAWPLAWIALVPLLVALRSGGLGRALLLAWLWCVIGAVVAGSWFPRAVAEYFHQSLAVSLALFAGVFTVMAGPYLMAFAAAYRALARRHRRALPFLAAAAFAAAELGRGRLLTGTPVFIGNPWGIVGYSQADLLPLLQIASVTGIYGVSFAVVCVNAAIAELWLVRRDAGRRGEAAFHLALAALPAAGALAFGAVELARAGPAAPAPDDVRVAIVQGNVSTGSRWRADLYGQNLDVYLQLTHEAAREDPPEIVFWPEAAMTFFFEDEPLYRRAVARVTAHDDLELVAGAPRRFGDDASPLFTNSIYAVAADGAIRGRYDKEYLVPFAEYFPLSIDLLKRRFGRIRTFEPGVDPPLLPTRAGDAGVLVCNEAMLPEVAGRRVARGARYLVNPSNDTWIPDPQYIEQQFDIATLRAIEQRRFLVRASTSGPSAIVDPWGRVQAASGHLTREVVTGAIRPLEERTVYGRVGDLFGLLCLGAVAAGLVRRPATR